ncbi:MAG: oxaloacetate decarboxylase subunit gamma [Gammaproteobacteria bacterium]|nr:MAG: oxaloacetate decarboxylase subunit gamma [Gammaproteobacteria bacterium]
MELSQLLLEALNLMLIGMLFVGIFLSILVFLTPLLNKIVPEEQPLPESKSVAVNGVQPQQAALVAVISAAIHQYRRHH